MRRPGVFRDLELEWQGVVYAIPANRIMGAIARIEEVVTLPELQAYAQRGTAPVAKLSMAFGSVLRYAGADISDDEVYAAALAENAEESGGVLTAVMNVMQIMIPPDVLKNQSATAVRETTETSTEGSLKSRSKRRSRAENG